jgi:hypothetical protein
VNQSVDGGIEFGNGLEEKAQDRIAIYWRRRGLLGGTDNISHERGQIVL